MASTNRLNSPEDFSRTLFEIMKDLNPGIADLDLIEFRYALENLLPEEGWAITQDCPTESEEKITELIHSRDFYESIQLKPRVGDRIVLDNKIARLTQDLFVGLVKGAYTTEWVNAHFYFDIRGFIFLPRTVYFTDEVLAHFGGNTPGVPYLSFEKRQKRLERFQGVGYKDFSEANAEIDLAFIESVKKIIAIRGTPILITLAGPTAAGKTEITERLFNEFEKSGRRITTIEVDNFLLDREIREDKVMGKETTHFDLFVHCIEEILQGRKVLIPRYDFVNATSSHDVNGRLKAGMHPPGDRAG